MRHAYYLDETTNKVKHAHRVAFDEGWNDSPDPPSYVRFLKGSLSEERLHLDDATKNMTVSLSPFNKVEIVEASFKPTAHIR